MVLIETASGRTINGCSSTLPSSEQNWQRPMICRLTSALAGVPSFHLSLRQKHMKYLLRKNPPYLVSRSQKLSKRRRSERKGIVTLQRDSIRYSLFYCDSR